MQPASRASLAEIQGLISRMKLQDCCNVVPREFNLKWRVISQAVRNNKMPMNSSSVARVLRQHIAESMSADEVESILNRLQLRYVIGQERVWHAISLEQRIVDLPAHAISRLLRKRVIEELKKGRGAKDMTPVVDTIQVDYLLYLRLQMVSALKQGKPLYAVIVPGEPLLFVTSPKSSSMIQAVVVGLGYKHFVNLDLYGPDITSLLRIYNKNSTDNVEYLVDMPNYDPVPVETETGVDYTNKTYNKMYVEELVGSDPPKLNELTIFASKRFFDPTRSNRVIDMKVNLKSDNIAETLKALVDINALKPNSDLFHVFHQMKSNKFSYEASED